MLSFFSTTPPPPPFYTLSLHDALPISLQIFVHFAAVHFYYFRQLTQARFALQLLNRRVARARTLPRPTRGETRDRKSTRLNSSHVSISYAVFCLKKKTSTLIIDVPQKL